MTAQNRVTDSFGQLIEEGRLITSTCGRDSDKYERFLAVNDCFLFRTKAITLIFGRAAENTFYHLYARML